MPEWKPSRWPGGTKDLVDGQKKALRCCFTSSHPDVLRGKDRVSERERRERERESVQFGEASLACVSLYPWMFVPTMSLFSYAHSMHR